MIKLPLKAERTYELPHAGKFSLGQHTLVMGILNVTPDSFSDGGKWNEIEAAVKHAEEMVAAGAEIIDIGAESTRPGADFVSEEEEKERLLPVVKALAGRLKVPLSVDTYKAGTAQAALKAGADIINDIWGLQYEAEPGLMAAVAAKYNVPVIVMHNCVNKPVDGDIVARVQEFFCRSAALAEKAGLTKEKIILDIGIGFGKTLGQNLELIRRQDEFMRFAGSDWPLLLGVSRKSFIGKVLAEPVAAERVAGTLSAGIVGMFSGAGILRVHDVAETVKTVKIAEAILDI